MVADPVMYLNELVGEHTQISWLSASSSQTVRSAATILPPPLNSPQLIILVLSYVDFLPVGIWFLVFPFSVELPLAVVHVFVSMHCCTLFKKLRPNGVLKCVLHVQGHVPVVAQVVGVTLVGSFWASAVPEADLMVTRSNPAPSLLS